MTCTHDLAERDTASLWDELCPLCLQAEVERLRERLGPRGLEIVEIGGAGHYVNEKVKAEIERLRDALALGREAVVESFDYAETLDDTSLAEARLQDIDAALTPAQRQEG